MATTPLVTDSLLIAALVDGRLVAYRRRDGRVVWLRAFGGEFGSERLLRVGGIVIVPHVSLHGVDLQTGALRWTYGGQGGDAGVITPGLAGDTVYVAGYLGGDAAALNAATGRVYWETNITQGVYRPTITESLALYPTHTGGGAGALVAVDRATGAERWRRILPDSAGFPGGAVSGGVVTGDRVVLGTFTSRVLALRIADGMLIWEQVGGNAQTAKYFSSPRLFEGDIAVMRSDLVLEGRSISDGSVRWTNALGGSSFRAPSPCAPYLCFADGRVWIFGPGGKIVWAFGGGDEVVFLSNVAVDDDGVMYAGVVRNNRGSVRAFRPPVAVGPTP